MEVSWATPKKAMIASQKHFLGEFNTEEMSAVVSMLLKNVTMIGTSDRANPGFEPATIFWADCEGTTYNIVLDSTDLKKNLATVISLYVIEDADRDYKINRFNMEGI